MYRDREQISGCQGLGGWAWGIDYKKTQGNIYGMMKILYVLIMVVTM